MKSHNTQTLILGLGNDILMDDGIGPKLVWYLEKKINKQNIILDTAAVGGMELIEIIKDYSKVIIIDAIKTKDGIPGNVYHLTPSNFQETSHISNLHDINFLIALQLAKQLGIEITEKIDIIAIEIVEDRTFGNEFTFALQNKFESIKKQVEKMVNAIIDYDE
ncbi:MAG: hydrogenase maturation protease [Bacteroidota bacterium]